MPHLHTNPGEYDHTVSGFIVKIVPGEEPKLLLHHHKVLNVLLQPGGHIELDETPWSALAHEVEEETGYELNQLSVLQPTNQLVISSLPLTVVHPIPVAVTSHGSPKWDNHYHTDSCYAMTTAEDPANPVKDGESDSLIWVTEQELQNIPEEQIIPGIRIIGLAVFTHFLQNWVPVPFTQYPTGNPEL